MNPRQVTALWIIAIVLGLAVALVKVRQQSAADTSTKRSPGDTLFEKFPAEQVSSVALTDAKGTLTLHKKDDGWVVAERDNYPARTPNVLSLIRTLAEIKIVQAMEAGPSFAPRFGMDESAKDADERGITASFADASGNEIARLSIGRTIESGGRFVRNHADETGFYAVNDMLFMFEGDPARWLDESFLRLEKIKSIHVANADNPEIKLWHVVRDAEDGDFRLADAAPGEMLEATAGDTLKRLMAFARFNDVIPAADVDARTADTAQARIATVTTFEGFTYTFTIVPATPKESADNPDDMFGASAGDDQLLTVSVEASLPTERKKSDDESEDASAELDKAFAERLETLTTRLNKEQTLAGRTFLVSKSIVEPLLKERDDITTGPPEPAAATATDSGPAVGGLLGPGATPAAPTGGVTVTTPPIEIPVSPAVEEDNE